MIHQYINNGFHIIMDVNSGSVHSVDPVMYDAVKIAAPLVPDMENLREGHDPLHPGRPGIALGHRPVPSCI